MQLSREAHLFLSLEEMREIRDRYQKLGRNPREIELELSPKPGASTASTRLLKAGCGTKARCLQANVKVSPKREMVHTPSKICLPTSWPPLAA